MTPALVATKLCRRYAWRGGHNDALTDVNLSVSSGQVLGLIGRNGAGKTTFVRIASTSLLPTSGALEILGHDAIEDPTPIRERIAVIPQESRPFYWLTPKELVAYYLRMRGATATEANARAKDALAELGITPWANTVVSRLSGGLRRRAMVAMVMASDAELVFLDEPTTGLDPLARRSVWESIRKATKSRRTILLTTHYLDEAEVLSDRLAILEGGRLLQEGTVADLSARVKHPYRVTLEGGFTEEDVASFGSVSHVGSKLLLFTGESQAREVARQALARGARISMGPVTLEDLFVQVVGKEITADGEDDDAEE